MLGKSLQAAAGNAGEATYIDDVFSTYLYTGNGSTQTITNGIDLAGEGGMVWIKSRSLAYSHRVFDTVRGATKFLVTNDTLAEDTNASTLTSFSSLGFSVGASTAVNENTTTYASWTFRKAPKFFDVVTWTGNGSLAGIDVAHSLAVKPGMVVMKRTNSTGNWIVMHRLDATNYRLLRLNTTGAILQNTDGTYYTSTSFRAYQFNQDTGNADDNMNVNGATYVAYLFAHNAGGFGADGSENVISCGSYTTDNGAASSNVNLGYEPQWLLVKQSSDTSNWFVVDTMRGLLGGTGNLSQNLYPNLSNAEADSGFSFDITSTGFKQNGGGAAGTQTCIYVAIRRPMKPPTAGTEVFAMDTQGSTTPRPPAYKSGFPVDWEFTKDKGTVGDWYAGTRLLGATALIPNKTNAETTSATFLFDYQSGWQNSTSIDSNRQGWMFKRAPGFFDVVCYSGTGSAPVSFNHNLQVIPELAIVKCRNDAATDWIVTVLSAANKSLRLNTTAAFVIDNGGIFLATYSTDTTFNVRTTVDTANGSGKTYIAYLFASLPGISKVGSYTGNGTNQTINCGFTSGARFVLIKRTDSTGDWYVWDTARGIVSANDPHLSLNTTVAEVTTDDTIDPASSGFIVNQVAATNVNVSSATYIYLAIA